MMKLPMIGWKPLAVLFAALAAGLVAIALVHRLTSSTGEVKVSKLAKDEIVVVRTTNGRLLVSTLVKNEEFVWQTSWTCPVINCGKYFPKTVSEVRLPVHYTFSIPLAGEWSLKFRGEYFELLVAKEEANIPPGLELAKLEMHTKNGWASPNALTNQVSLMKHLGPELAIRARRPEYVNAQRDEARKTVAEFARKWMVEQGAGKGKADYPIRVFFVGEVN